MKGKNIRKEILVMFAAGFVFAFLFCIIGIIHVEPVDALAATFLNKFTKEQIEYEKCDIKYVYNGCEIPLNDDCGILGESGSALGPLNTIFKNALSVSCVYQLSDQSIVLSTNEAKVKITIGSKDAIVNGKKITLSEAPVILCKNGGCPCIYVPTKVIATNLGFQYEWNSTLSTVSINRTSTFNYQSNLDEKPIEVPLYGSFTLDDIRIEDRYYNHEIAIYIPGDYVAEYKKNAIKNRYSAVKSIELGTNGNGETFLLFKTTKVKACQLKIVNQTLYITLSDPDKVYSKIVIIDPGHGGRDSGAVRDGLYESNFNLSIAYEYTKDLFENSDIKVYYTRVNDKYSTIDTRAAYAKEVKADFYVSVHQNTSEAASMSGTSVYYSSENNKTLENGLSSKVMARLFRDNLTSRLETKNLNIINHPLTVTTYNSVPSVLIELLFMSNENDLNRLKSESFRKDAGRVIFDTVKELFATYPTGR